MTNPDWIYHPGLSPTISPFEDVSSPEANETSLVVDHSFVRLVCTARHSFLWPCNACDGFFANNRRCLNVLSEERHDTRPESKGANRKP